MLATRVSILALAFILSGPAQAELRGPAERRLPAEKVSPRPVQPPTQAAPAHGTVYSPWVKYCGTDPAKPEANPVCLTVKEARLETGAFLAGAALIERAGEEKRLLRISVAAGIRIIPTARVFIDGEAMKTLPPPECLPNGCFAGFEVTADMIEKLKRGELLRLEGINIPGWIASWPLEGFARAFDGAPTDPKKFEEEQRRLQDELLRLQKKAK